MIIVRLEYNRLIFKVVVMDKIVIFLIIIIVNMYWFLIKL